MSEQSGMTLIETVLYIALFAIIFLSVMNFVMSVTEHNQESESRTKVQQSLIQIQEHIAEKMESATAIDEVSSLFEIDSGVLVLTVSGASANYQISDGRLVYVTGGMSTPISSSKIVVNQFYLEGVLDREGAITGVRITLSVESFDESAPDTMITSYIL